MRSARVIKDFDSALAGFSEGRHLQNAPTQHTIKATDCQFYKICQRCDPHGQLRTLTLLSQASLKEGVCKTPLHNIP